MRRAAVDTRTLALPLPDPDPGTRCPWFTRAELDALSFALDQLEALARLAARRRAYRPPVQLALFQ